MNAPRRVVMSVALAALLLVVAAGINRMLVSPPSGGWFMYTPNAESVFSSEWWSNAQLLREGAVWLAAVAVWFGVSWWRFAIAIDPAIQDSGVGA